MFVCVRACKRACMRACACVLSVVRQQAVVLPLHYLVHGSVPIEAIVTLRETVV